MGSVVEKHSSPEMEQETSGRCAGLRRLSSGSKSQEVPPSLTPAQKHILQESWKTIRRDVSRIGVITFLKLFETHPDVQNSFMPFRGLTATDMEQSAILRSHALRVMQIVEKCVARLDNISKVEAMMMNLGEKHSAYNAKKEYMEMMGPQFVYAIRRNIPEDEWTYDMELAWLTLFKVMVFYMNRGMKKAGRGT